MRRFFLNLFQFMLVSFFVFNIVEGITLPLNLMYYVASILILSITLLMVSPILDFLTIKENFITTFLMSSIVAFGMVFLLDLFMTGFYIDSYTFEGKDFGSLVVNSFEMTPVLISLISGILAGFVGSTLAMLEKRS